MQTAFSLPETIALLSRTPSTLNTFLRGLPSRWVAANEGFDSWRRPNELSFVFGEAGEAFHNTFVFDPSARAWQWRMDAEHQGRLQPFARVQLTRVAESDR